MNCFGLKFILIYQCLFRKSTSVALIMSRNCHCRNTVEINTNVDSFSKYHNAKGLSQLNWHNIWEFLHYIECNFRPLSVTWFIHYWVRSNIRYSLFWKYISTFLTFTCKMTVISDRSRWPLGNTIEFVMYCW